MTKNDEIPRIIRFIAVGLLNTVFGFLAFSLVLFVTGSAAIAIVLSTVLGVVFNYFTTGRLVFLSRGISKSRFVLCYGASMCLNYVVFKTLNTFIESEHVCQLMALFPTTITTYLLLRNFVFAPPAISGTEK